jgi:hypothetical protein
MLHTVEQEPMFRYLLGELSEKEQREIEERYFTDTEYFEDLLKLEEDLIDEYAQDKALSGKHEKRDRTLVAKIEELPETRFAKEWINGIVEMKVRSGGEDRAASLAKLRPEFQNERGPVLGVAGFYDAELAKAKSAIRRQEVEDLLAQAWADRELVSALMDVGWLGLKLLMVLKSKAQMSASDLAAAAGVRMDLVAPILVRLVRFDAIREDTNLFSLTERGNAVIQNLEGGMIGTL